MQSKHTEIYYSKTYRKNTTQDNRFQQTNRKMFDNEPERTAAEHLINGTAASALLLSTGEEKGKFID